MKIRSLLYLILLGIIVVGAVGAIRPYWDKYALGEAMETAAVYGTKNSVQATRDFLARKMEAEGLDFRGEDFTIRKEGDTVHIRITYRDSIEAFGYRLRPLRFTVKKEAVGIEERF